MGLNSLHLECRLALVTFFLGQKYEKEKNSNLANIPNTNNNYWYHISHEDISPLWYAPPKCTTYLIMKKIRQTQIEGHPTKYLVSIFHKYQGHERPRRDWKTHRLEETKKDLTTNPMWYPRLNPGTAEKSIVEKLGKVK